MKLNRIALALLLLLFMACNTDDGGTPDLPEETQYFPPLTGSAWETTSMASLGWNEDEVAPLEQFLREKNSKSFLILVKGRIVMEAYFDGHTASTSWQWNSAGKTLVAAVTGIAEEAALVDLDAPVSEYLEQGWTSAPADKEALITPWHLLSMTTGLEDVNLVRPAGLTYVADAGTRWSYSNVFQRLMDVVAATEAQDFETYFNARLKQKIGMDGFWVNGTIFKIYHSTTRSMARFGLLALNQGTWNNEPILNSEFFNASTATSQSINPAYGYFWWLNGKNSFMVPGGQTVYPGQLVPQAPADMFAAMGAEDQRIYVVPSRDMVVVRMGNVSDPNSPSFALSGFDDALWERINAVIN